MTKTIKEVLVELADKSSPVATLKNVPNPLVKPENIDLALSEIEKIMDGVIGEDEAGVTISLDDNVKENAEFMQQILWQIQGENRLRTTQRQSLKEVLGE